MADSLSQLWKLPGDKTSDESLLSILPLVEVDSWLVLKAGSPGSAVMCLWTGSHPQPLVTFGADYSFVVGGYPVHCRVFHSVLGLCHQKAAAPPQVGQPRISLTFPRCPTRTKLSLFETPCFRFTVPTSK